MQKLLLTIFAFAAWFSIGHAQLDVKLNPIALLAEVGLFSVEYTANESWGLETEVILASNTTFIFAQGKHYFKPKRGADRFNIGALMGVLSSNNGGRANFGLGFFTGYKWISSKNVLFEMAVGVGRAYATDYSFFPYGKLNLGYRFNKKVSKK